MIKRHTVILAVIMFSNVCGILFIHARREVPDLGDRLVAAYHLVKGDGVVYGMNVTAYGGFVHFAPSALSNNEWIEHNNFKSLDVPDAVSAEKRFIFTGVVPLIQQDGRPARCRIDDAYMPTSDRESTK